ncbi:MAG: hypothetical protein Q8R31_04470, partial [Candidatus Omnitrophota bacterium]|nr:hypothetical protein [Candidatus Omnitrophota bacterium]
LKTGKWKGTSFFNIHNSTQETLYNIYVKLEIEESGINYQDVEVVPKNESDFIQGQLGDLSVKFDIVRIISTDVKGKDCIILIIYSLSPNEDKPFRIKIKETLNSNIEETKISINLMKYSKEPVQILSQDKGKIAFPISFSEQLTIKGFSLFIKRNKQYYPIQK